jgi:vacuolar-type H+-ATPase subunit D/Vma8
MKEKLTEEQLRILKSKLESLTRIHAEIGMLDSKKHELLHDSVAAKTKLQDYQKELQEEYGDISINIEDGTFTKPE